MVTIRRPPLNAVAAGDRTLRAGANGPHVEKLQQLLNKKGARLVVDGDFGPATMAAVKKFQTAQGLRATGSLDHNTLAKLEGPNVHRKDEFIQKGDETKGVLATERGLKKLGYDVGAVDGKYDAGTAKAVAAFRHDEGLKKSHGGSMTGSVQGLVRTELKKLNHAPLHTRVKPTAPRTRLDAATATAAGAVDVAGNAGIGPGSGKRVVSNVQAHLRAAGFDPKHTKGVFDERTATALKAFQSESGLPPTGRVDGATWGKLKKATLEATTSTQHGQRVGERGGAVLHTEKVLKKLGMKTGAVDGVFDAKTRAAVMKFEKAHHRHVDGAVSTGDLKAMEKAAKGAAAGGVEGISARGKRQMANLLAVAKRGAEGQSPQGWCLREVQNYLDQTAYGKGKVPRLPYARNYAEYLNRDGNAARLGFKKLNITNPYDAPPGAIVVVRAGTPGTAHPTAGDIVVKGPGDKFYNDGEMGYGGRGNFPRGNDYVLGVYVPV
ncbi:MAG: peptidoglycan-binding protein [Deltaproteobacteria bacterium]|nr:peptidoglycan-binding protein [Deltaproteobacteria bacterium]